MPDPQIVETILIVDDERRLRNALGRSLYLEGRNILTAASAEEALELVKERVIDLVITDLVMPGRGGLDFLMELQERIPDVKMIIITAYPTQDAREAAFRLGVLKFIEKPFDLLDLKYAVRKALVV